MPRPDDTTRNVLEATVADASYELKQFPRLTNGLVSDAVRRSVEYVTAKRRFRAAFDALRAFNSHRCQLSRNA